MNSEFRRSIIRISEKNGADLIGVAPIDRFSEHGGEGHPSHYLYHARSVIVIGIHMFDPMLDAWIRSAQRDYYVVNEILGGIGSTVIEYLRDNKHRAVLSPYSGVFTKDAGVLADLGIIGRNNLLITRQYGPRVRLRAILTDAEIESATEKPDISCNGCPNHCWSACPARAFPDGQYNKEICAEYSEQHLKWLSDNAFLYCRECELACPHGSR